MPLITILAWTFAGVSSVLLIFIFGEQQYGFLPIAISLAIAAVFCFAIGQIIELLTQIRDILRGEKSSSE